MEQKESNHQVPKSRAPKSTFLAKDQTGASEVRPHIHAFPTSKIMILIWKDRYLSRDPRRSGKRSFGSFIWPELIFYQDISGKRPSRARGDFDVSIGPSHRAKGLSSS
ncbi:unnamed protein product [Microthlaspi erraticum]|uniref:Uncharacterized protein n=1 Tax=Microthlaspi erraticum TaxID=1685480 RepID=A0A6D2JXL0_9BRAS|nr:unnamed protein product [Microthlaspi erraticum]